MSKLDYKYLLMKMKRHNIEEALGKTLILQDNPILKANREAGGILIELIIIIAFISQNDDEPDFFEMLKELSSSEKVSNLLECWKYNFPDLQIRFSASPVLSGPDKDDALALLEIVRTQSEHTEIKNLLELIQQETLLAPYAISVVLDEPIKADAGIFPTEKTYSFLE